MLFISFCLVKSGVNKRRREGLGQGMYLILFETLEPGYLECPHLEGPVHRVICTSLCARICTSFFQPVLLSCMLRGTKKQSDNISDIMSKNCAGNKTSGAFIFLYNGFLCETSPLLEVISLIHVWHLALLVVSHRCESALKMAPQGYPSAYFTASAERRTCT